MKSLFGKFHVYGYNRDNFVYSKSISGNPASSCDNRRQAS